MFSHCHFVCYCFDLCVVLALTPGYLFLVWIFIKIICSDYTPSSCALLAQHPWQNSRPTKWVILVAFVFLFCFVYPLSRNGLSSRPTPVPGADGPFAGGPYQGLSRSGVSYPLPGPLALCFFYITSLSEQCKACLPANGPKEEDFAALLEWVLENNWSPLTVCPSDEDISSPTNQTIDQPAIIPLHGATAWAHCRRRACLSSLDGTSSLKRTVRYGIHGPSYGPCMCGRSTWVFRPPRASPKHDGRS